MSYQIWKCKHCSDTNESKTIIDKHESTCYVNEENKKCFSCKHHKEMGYPIGGSDMRCMNKEAPTYDKNMSYYFDDFTEEEEEAFYPCECWESDDE